VTCSNRNILLNGGFRRGLAPWVIQNSNRVRNPIYQGDASMLMGISPFTRSVVKQKIQTSVFEHQCAYYLYFRVYNDSPIRIKVQLFATVVYLDRRGNTLRTTPLMITLPQAKNRRFSPYFVIVPSPPKETHSISVSFFLPQGRVYVDYIRLAAHDISTH
jgi:hypothetical protein